MRSFAKIIIHDFGQSIAVLTDVVNPRTAGQYFAVEMRDRDNRGSPQFYFANDRGCTLHRKARRCPFP